MNAVSNLVSVRSLDWNIDNVGKEAVILFYQYLLHDPVVHRLYEFLDILKNAVAATNPRVELGGQKYHFHATFPTRLPRFSVVVLVLIFSSTNEERQ